MSMRWRSHRGRTEFEIPKGHQEVVQTCWRCPPGGRGAGGVEGERGWEELQSSGKWGQEKQNYGTRLKKLKKIKKRQKKKKKKGNNRKRKIFQTRTNRNSSVTAPSFPSFATQPITAAAFGNRTRSWAHDFSSAINHDTPV